MSRHAKRALGLRQGVEQQEEEGPRCLRALRDNGLSLAFWALFALSLAGTLLAGYALQREHHASTAAARSLWSYALSADLLRSILVNWQAVLLQLLVLILLARVLRQRGASHSRQPGEHESAEEKCARAPIALGLSPLIPPGIRRVVRPDPCRLRARRLAGIQ